MKSLTMILLTIIVNHFDFSNDDKYKDLDQLVECHLKIDL